ncbi:hypothetical protein PLESTB_001690600 [Pleodorina starrii]|uniref:Uncharacterized protein n=1 Tax=Pleodorina starrii TaxID=330485 RepID=A0A9W6F936_9CHLO|nr:hypothetical protein PLESTB_001690600 [Pleodorina starrii]GLC66636.1 hypothetical protein PLESTF_000455400 [Pleodorina starrii]
MHDRSHQARGRGQLLLLHLWIRSPGAGRQSAKVWGWSGHQRVHHLLWPRNRHGGGASPSCGNCVLPWQSPR